MTKIKSHLLVAITSLILLVAGNMDIEIQSDNTVSNNHNYPLDAAYHTPIDINGNDELATFIDTEDLSGDGTYGSPYVIEGFTIDASATDGIFISNTDANLIIRDCTIEGGSYSHYEGIQLYNTKNVNISNNKLISNYRGIYLYSSSNNTISANNANDNIIHGICLEYSSNNTIYGNNTIYNNEIGIILWSSSNNTIYGNTASYNTVSGIYLGESSNNTIYGNNINCNYAGISLHYSSINNIIHFNDICGNQNVQGFEGEDCTDNQWDNGSIGNFWGNDYKIEYPDATNDGTVWDTPYEIGGEVDGMDKFPLLNPIFPDFQSPRFTDIPQDFKVNEGYSGLNISWTPIDLNPATYKIEQDGTEVVSATAWVSGTAISYDIPNGLLEGNYYFTIIISDENGKTAQDTVKFSVILDIDGDGMPDNWETQYNLNPLNASDAEDDPDGDGFTNLEEYLLGLNPRDSDTDNDGVPDNVDLYPSSFFMPTGLIILILGSGVITYTILKIIKKRKKIIVES